MVLRDFYSRNQVQRINALLDPLWDTSGPRRNHTLDNLYLTLEEIRRVALSLRLCEVLSELLEGTPVLRHTCNERYGGEAADHRFEEATTGTPATAAVRAWMALDPVTTSTGPVRYVPGSHLKSGHFRHPRVFTARTGDILLWHPGLLIGGEPVRDPMATRRSLSALYSRREDQRLALWRLRRRHENGFLQIQPQSRL